jgi:hypothetical protein
MATIDITLKLVSSTISSDEALNLTVRETLTTSGNHQGLSSKDIGTVGGNNIIQPNLDGQTYFVYIKHTGVDAAGATVTTTLNIENTDDVVMGKLAPGEFVLLPSGGASKGVQLQSSSGSIIAEYAYWTRA